MDVPYRVISKLCYTLNSNFNGADYQAIQCPQQYNHRLQSLDHAKIAQHQDLTGRPVHNLQAMHIQLFVHFTSVS